MQPAIPARLTRRPTAQFVGLVWLLAAGYGAAIAFRQPAVAAVVTPCAVWLALGLARSGPSNVALRLTVARDRALEGEVVDATVEVESDSCWDRVECELMLPEGVRIDEDSPRIALRLDPCRRANRRLPIAVDLLGAHRLGPIMVHARDRYGLFTYEGAAATTAAIRVYPGEQRLRTLVQAWRTQISVGNRQARARGEGFEFADVRPFLPGDSVRWINWRIAARRSALHINLRHPERSVDVVCFLDAFDDLRLGAEGTLDLALRAIAAVARSHLRQRDRVGLVSFGGTMRWLMPGQGSSQVYRVCDALLDTDVVLSHAWKDVDVLPARTLPPSALVLAFSPLLDPRSIEALCNLAGRGHDVSVVEIAPEPFTDTGRSWVDRMAWRTWRVRRSHQRQRLLAAGVPLARWRRGTPLEATLTELTRLRRQRWHTSA